MSSAQGFPDWQRITQWLGPPVVTETGRVLNAGTITDGPYQVSNFASVIVALKAIGGNVTVTIKQTVPAGPASLVLTESVVVAAGATLFEAFVLYGGAVELDLTGGGAGTSVDYALYGSNTTTNAQVITSATINVQHNDVLVAAESTLDFEDGTGWAWSIVDDAAGTRVKITPPIGHGQILAYGKRTANVSTAGTTFAAGADVLAADLSFTADGVSDYLIEISGSNMENSLGALGHELELKLDGVAAGYIFARSITNAGYDYDVSRRTLLVAPAAGVHTVNGRFYVGAGTGTLFGGAGGAAVARPLFMTVAKA